MLVIPHHKKPGAVFFVFLGLRRGMLNRPVGLFSRQGLYESPSSLKKGVVVFLSSCSGKRMAGCAFGRSWLSRKVPTKPGEKQTNSPETWCPSQVPWGNRRRPLGNRRAARPSTEPNRTSVAKGIGGGSRLSNPFRFSAGCIIMVATGAKP